MKASKKHSYIINYENISIFKSIKRQKKSNSSSYYSSSSSSPSSIDYDIISPETTTPSFHVSTNYYLNENQADDHVYDHLSSNNSRALNVFKVIEDYTADFKGDLSVRRGDIVNLIDTIISPNKNADYLFVRIFKRNLKAATTLAEAQQIEYQNVQGYIPRSHVIKI